jgi:UrcA family protein
MADSKPAARAAKPNPTQGKGLTSMTRLFAAFMFAFAIVPAAYAADAVPKGIVVGYGDLDLNAAAGQAVLKDRLQAAAAKLCSPVFAGPDYRGSEQSARELMVVHRACIGRLSNRAMANIERTAIRQP